MGLFGDWLSEFFDFPAQPVPVRVETRSQSVAQWRDLTPERRPRITETAGHQVDRQTRDATGRRSTADVFRRVMGGR